MDNSAKYASLREQYPCFEYKGFEYGMEQGDFKVQFHFVCKEHSFSPTHVFKQKDFYSFSHLSKEQTVSLVRFLKKWYKFDSDISINIMHMVEDTMFDDDVIAISAIW